MDYTPPLRDMQFALHEILDATAVLGGVGIDIDADTIDGLLEGAGDFAARVIAPLNGPGDRQGCRHDGTTVVTPDGFKEAYAAYAAGGWTGVDADEGHGGGGMPGTIGSAIKEMLASANPSWTLYTSLSSGAYRCLNENASEELKEKLLPALASGRWTGTMCLTEPQAGTDLGLLTTKATPQDDGSYRISGTKIFITSGEHDLSENIVHLVLARTPDAPAGTRGISLFAVSKREIADDGTVGERNGVYCDSIETKMGLHGSSTCVLRFDNAVGQLVGEVNRGLIAMFVMMNGARLGTGVQALGASEAAAQLSLRYARERVQSRAPGSLRDAGKPADAIIDQPDVRRMLLTQQAWVGGGRLFLYWLALQHDVRKRSSDPQARSRAETLLSLLTPVAKAFASDRAVETASLAMQIHGGAGYVCDYAVEQIARDARILPIYEGTNGVQAHDLLGRKVIGDSGQHLGVLLGLVRDFTGQADNQPGMKLFTVTLEALTDDIETLAGELIGWSRTDDLRVGTSAVDFLELIGHYVYAYFWARVAAHVIGLGADASPYHRRQLALAQFYFDKLLPNTAALLIRARSSSDVLMDSAALEGILS